MAWMPFVDQQRALVFRDQHFVRVSNDRKAPTTCRESLFYNWWSFKLGQPWERSLNTITPNLCCCWWKHGKSILSRNKKNRFSSLSYTYFSSHVPAMKRDLKVILRLQKVSCTECQSLLISKICSAQSHRNMHKLWEHVFVCFWTSTKSLQLLQGYFFARSASKFKSHYKIRQLSRR